MMHYDRRGHRCRELEALLARALLGGLFLPPPAFSQYLLTLAGTCYFASFDGTRGGGAAPSRLAPN